MYAVLQNIIDAIGADALLAIADRDGDGNVDAPVVAEALLDASGEIDGAVGARYTLPMPFVPRRLRRIAVDLAIYHMDQNPTEDLQRRVKDARTALAAIRDGREILRDAALAESGEEPKGGGASDDLAQVQPFATGMDMGGYS